jgi:Asp-tRNA(Asn)/Glu-tRNA(Gln) amidotransferase A subunit family amidase
MPAESLIDLSATELATRMRRCEFSPVEVIEAHLERIRLVNPRLNAIVTLPGDEARAQARACERALAHGAPGVLLGVPFTAKDVLATAGVRTTCGSRLFANHIPDADATVVARIKAAGGILLGKTNCPEFALDLQTDNLLFGPTRNPWDEQRTPGGSSGGDSAAVASGCTPLGIGTDFGGSLRWPAQCTGLVTIRPTTGLVPATGRLPSASPLVPPPPNSLSFEGQVHVLGPLARSVDDLKLVLRVLAGPDGTDGQAMPVPLGDPNGVDVRQLAYAWCDGEGAWPVRPDVVAVAEQVARHLGRLGLRIDRRAPPGLDRAEGIYSRLRAAEGLPAIQPLVGDRTEELGSTVRDLLEQSPPRTIAELLAINTERDVVRAQLMEFMREYPVILLPVAAVPAFPVGQRAFRVDNTNLPYWQVLACCRAVSLLGLPAAVVPCGRSVEGLPVGVQVVGRPFEEATVLAVARLLEREFGGVQRPSELSIPAGA